MNPLHLRPILSLLLVLQAAGALIPGPSLWGINHLAHIDLGPPPLRLLWPVLGLGLLWSRAPSGSATCGPGSFSERS